MNPTIREENAILLVHPPAAKACEAPGGPARLAGGAPASRRRLPGLGRQSGGAALADGGRKVDRRPSGSGSSGGKRLQSRVAIGIPAGGEEAIPHPVMVGGFPDGEARGKGIDTWTRRAAKHLVENLAALRSRDLYRHPDRYRRVVTDLNRLSRRRPGLPASARALPIMRMKDYPPSGSADLRHAAAGPETNPFYPWFRERLPEISPKPPLRTSVFR